MSSLAVSLPLEASSVDGFQMIKGFRRLIKQNLKMLLLTIPGERVMEPNFGVGLKTYLFSNFHQDIYSEIETKISDQIDFYLPTIRLKNIAFSPNDQDLNILTIHIEYDIPAIGTQDLLEFTI